MNIAKSDGRPFNEMIQYYAMERFLYRLSVSQFRENYILKGALLLKSMDSNLFRPTRDIDFLGITSNEENNVREQISEITNIPYIEDGLEFDSETIETERITEDADYQGIRVRLIGYLGKIEIHLQLDIGFGDIVTPEPTTFTFPTILQHPSPELVCYPLETAIAEKLQIVIHMGFINSRMKDFFDIWVCSRQLHFNGEKLAKAIKGTFNNRQTDIPEDIEAFKDEFMRDKHQQWKAFTKKIQQSGQTPEFPEVINDIKRFALPVLSAIRNDFTFSKDWDYSNGWL